MRKGGIKKNCGGAAARNALPCYAAALDSGRLAHVNRHVPRGRISPLAPYACATRCPVLRQRGVREAIISC
eukprot:3122802-Rhodomonas_salina.1